MARIFVLFVFILFYFFFSFFMGWGWGYNKTKNNYHKKMTGQVYMIETISLGGERYDEYVFRGYIIRISDVF